MASGNEERAEQTRGVAREIGDMLYEKQRAYGDVASLQLGLWQVLLEQYRDGEHYRLPVALIAHLPRLTRVFDRIGRIVSNPAGDLMNEDPWRDLAGDAIVGVVMPRYTNATAVPHPADTRFWSEEPLSGLQGNGAAFEMEAAPAAGQGYGDDPIENGGF